MTPKNADRRECQWQIDAQWRFDHPSCAFTRLGTGNPFLAQLLAVRRGEMRAWAIVDGIVSNELILRVE